MKKIILFLLAVSGVFTCYAQDFIVKAENDTVRCKILDVNEDAVMYQTLNNGVTEKHTLSRKYIVSYTMGDGGADAAVDGIDKKTTVGSFRLAVAGGYAGRLGQLQKTNNPNLDRISDDLTKGYSLNAEFQYYFNEIYGIALNLNYVHSSGKGQNVNIPNFGSVADYRETQKIFFVGPAFAIRYDTKNWLITSSIGLGPLFFTDRMWMDQQEIQGTATTFGMNLGVGAEYKLSRQWAAGLKLSMTSGTIDSINVEGTKVSFDDKMSLSSWMIAAYISFRTK